MADEATNRRFLYALTGAGVGLFAVFVVVVLDLAASGLGGGSPTLFSNLLLSTIFVVGVPSILVFVCIKVANMLDVRRRRRAFAAVIVVGLLPVVLVFVSPMILILLNLFT